MEPKNNLPLWRLVLAALLAVSFVYSGYTIFFRSTSSRMTLGDDGTDHISHANAAVLFWYRGCAIYRTPVDELLQRETSAGAVSPSVEEWQRPELFRLPERRNPAVPLWLNWPELARVYPPGLYLYSAVEAVGLECTAVPLWAVSAFALLKYSLVAHLLLWVFCDFLLVHYSWRERESGLVPAWGLLLLLMLAVQIQVCFWTVSGVYDGLALLFLILLVVSYKRRLWAEALFFFAVAVFFHYRSLWFFPLAGLAAWQLWRQGLGQLLAGRRQTLLLMGSGLLLAVSGFFFLLAYPALGKFPLNNPFYFKAPNLEAVSWPPVGVLILLLAVLVLRRDWLLLTSTTGVLLFLLNTRQLQHWHSLSLTPLTLCSAGSTSAGLFRGALAYGVLSFLFVQVCPFDPIWGAHYYLGW